MNMNRIMVRQDDRARHHDKSHMDHLYAQQLSNMAASCIEVGEHDRAVAFLVKALCLSRSNKATYTDIMCSCSSCSLDECIAYSEQRASLHQETEREDSPTGPKAKRRKIEGNGTSSLPRIADEMTDNSIGYTHKRPIFVPPHVIHEGHIMGPIIALIITFNLALANHLKLIEAVSSEDNRTSKSTATRESFGKVLRLYELAYRWEGEMFQRQQQHGTCNNNNISSNCNERQQQQQQQQQQQHEEDEIDYSFPQHTNMKSCSGLNSKCSSLRFDMIVCNNLSQIHRLAQNYSKQEKCLQHLLSIMMFVVDWQRERDHSNDDEQDDDEHEDDEVDQNHQQQEIFLSEESTTPLHVDNNDDIATTTSTTTRIESVQEPQVQQRRNGKRKRPVNYMDLDGFLRNVSPFLLKDDCAEAA